MYALFTFFQIRAIHVFCFQEVLNQNVILHALPAEKYQVSKTVYLNGRWYHSWH